MPGDASQREAEEGRREAVLDSAMQTFSRFGYRKTSMDDIAEAAGISRPGLYFLFDSKPALFRESVTRTLERDLDRIALSLADTSRPLRVRLIDAFDRWAGSYIGPLDRDLRGRDDDRQLIGSVLDAAPARFEKLIVAAIGYTHPEDARARARTLVSASVGIKHQVESRDEYIDILAIAVGLLVADAPPLTHPRPHSRA
jgi:AcrR family transcriptional regulator